VQIEFAWNNYTRNIIHTFSPYRIFDSSHRSNTPLQGINSSLESAVQSIWKNLSMSLKPGKYRHFKGGEYAVQGVARHSENEELLVVYTPLYGEGGLWVRPLDMFLEQVQHDGELRSRFEFVGSLD
jgi:hypothetical protein